MNLTVHASAPGLTKAVGAFLLLFAIVFGTAVAACGAEPLRIAAAADLQPALPSLLREFTHQYGIAAEASYQSSATLAQQIENGASFDLFMSADTSYPQRLIDAGLTEQQHSVVYAQGTLVLWAPRTSPLLARHGGSLTLDLLRDSGLHSLAIANPEHAPYGRAAVAALRSLGLLPTLTPRLVTGENIAQAAQFVSTGNAQAGLISLTSALTPAMQAQGVFVRIPSADYPPLLQGAVTLKGSARLSQAHQWMNYLASAPVRKILAERGLASAN